MRTHPTSLRCGFNGAIQIEGRAERLTADAGVLPLRELDDKLGFTENLAAQLIDSRNPARITHPLEELLRARLYLLAQGRRHQDDVDRLRHDPALRIAVSERRGEAPLRPSETPLTPDGLASQPTQSRLIETLSLERNREILEQAVFDLARRDVMATRGRRFPRVTIDVDSMPVEVCGEQPGSAYSGYFKTQCYHPMVTMLAETGHFLSATLRPGNASTAQGVVEHLEAVIDRTERELGRVVSVRGDAGFPEEKLLSALEDRHVRYVFRLKNNARLNRLAAPHLRRPPGRPPAEPRAWVYELSYEAVAWERERRVVLVVQERPGELFLHHFFLVTNASVDRMAGEEVLMHYRQRGTMEGHLGELKSVLAPALSSAPRPKSHIRDKKPKVSRPPRNGWNANRVTFLLYVLGYNLANSARGILNRARPRSKRGGWSLSRLRAYLLLVAARFTIHSRRVTVVIANQANDLWRAFWRGLARLKPLPQPDTS